MLSNAEGCVACSGVFSVRSGRLPIFVVRWNSGCSRGWVCHLLHFPRERKGRAGLSSGAVVVGLFGLLAFSLLLWMVTPVTAATIAVNFTSGTTGGPELYTLRRDHCCQHG